MQKQVLSVDYDCPYPETLRHIAVGDDIVQGETVGEMFKDTLCRLNTEFSVALSINEFINDYKDKYQSDFPIKVQNSYNFLILFTQWYNRYMFDKIIMEQRFIDEF